MELDLSTPEQLDKAIAAKACAVIDLKDRLYHLERELVALCGLRVDQAVASSPLDVIRARQTP